MTFLFQITWYMNSLTFGLPRVFGLLRATDSSTLVAKRLRAKGHFLGAESGKSLCFCGCDTFSILKSGSNSPGNRIRRQES